METLILKKRILVLDKDTRVLNAVDEILTTGNWDVSILFDPNAVYDKAKTYKPDLVILDYVLVDTDCQMICEDFKNDPALRSVPIIIVTAYKSKKVSAQSYNCDALFVKPLDMQVLAGRMDYLLAS
ncbi:response regulator [Mucilaginibacter glaciei]|uniref:Response regulator transcription factor n=1 Tax=Mucilaginibacter glaciei TaxID=2772109 RepID=A0A926NKY3_9SPHI|nr:response regulator [Mucilaginibacter glaciei]MBD1391546.1 response regulator transcription factor [Mucilaginibacter glaciei]